MRYKTYFLEDVLKIKYGKNQKKVKDDNGDYPILGTGGLMGYANDYLYDQPSVLIGRKGSISRVRFIDQPFWTVDTLFYTEVNEEIVFPKYIYYYLSLIDFNYYNEGTTIPSLRTQTLNQIKVTLPNKNGQSKILNVLNPIDNKIESNNSIISNLEELAQTLFKYWFVDFEFPNENGEPYKSSGGKMIESELGMIPERSNTKKLKDIAQLIMGLSPKSDTYNTNEEGLPLLNGAADFEGTTLNPTRYTSDPKRISEKWDLVLCIRATIGNLTYADRKYSLGRGVASVRLYKEEYRELLYFFILNSIQKLKSQATGSVISGLSKPDIEEIDILVPSQEVLYKFHKIVSSIQLKQRSLITKNENLTELRDTLLPKLLSGEIELPDDMEVTEDVPIS